MHPPEKTVTQDRMQEILARRSVGAAPPLAWDKPVKTGERSGYMQSVCGKFTLSRDVVGEDLVYCAWRVATIRNHMADNLGCVKTVEEAKELAEKVNREPK